MKNPANPRGNYKNYTLLEKQSAVQLAEEHTFAYASEHLKIPTSTIHNWKRSLKSTLTGGMKRTGLRITYESEKDFQIRDWVLRMRDNLLPVTRKSLCDYAKTIIDRPGFKATDGWLKHFLKRHELSLRTRTTVAQNLPHDLERRVAAFTRYLIEQRLHTDFECVVNMDETAIFFDQVPNRTIARKGQKTVFIRSTGAEKRHLTAVLAVTSREQVLPPLVIFKGKRWPKDVTKVPEGVHMVMQQKGWMDEEVMTKWVNDILLPFTGNRSSLLVLDSFSGHTTPSVRDQLDENDITPAVIPGGCTSKIQPLDVSINKPFKEHLRQLWTGYMTQQSQELAAKIPTASRQQMLEWVGKAWAGIASNPDMICRSFDACGITTALATAEEELNQSELVLQSALLTDDSESEFEGFTTADIPDYRDEDSQDPFQ